MIHIAGWPVLVGNELRQLCAWCGARLIDMDLSRVAVSPKEDGSPGGSPGTWKTGALVEIEGNGSWVVAHEDGAQLPPNCCAGKPSLRLVTP